MASNLTKGAIKRILSENGIECRKEFKPVLLVAEVVTTHSVLLSDGTDYHVGLLPLSLKFHDLVQTERLQKGSVVQLTKFAVFLGVKDSQIQKFIVIADLELMGQPLHLNGIFVKLTQGAIKRISSDNFSSNEEFKPVLQVIGLENSSIWLSDGTHFNVGLLNKKSGLKFFPSEMFQKGSAVQLTHFIIDVVENNIIINDLVVILDKCVLIGDPVPIHKSVPLPPVSKHICFNDTFPSLSARKEDRMTVNLTQRAIARISSNNFFYHDEELVLQVIDLDNSFIWLSDGTHYNVGIINNTLKGLTYFGMLQKGSIVKLATFNVCMVENYRIIFGIRLNVMLDKCELIGEPVPLHIKVPLPPNVSHLWFYKVGKHITPLNLTQGAIERIIREGSSCDEEFKPVLQVIGLKGSNIWLSDGTYYNVAIAVENLAWSGRLRRGSVVTLTSFTVHVVTYFKVLSNIDLNVMLDKCELIGEPVPLDKQAPSPQDFADLRFSDWRRMDASLTPGAIERINSDNLSCDEVFKPVLQVIDLKNSRIWLSDGTHYSFAKVAKNMACSSRLQKGSVVKLTRFKVCSVEDYKVLSNIDLDVVVDKFDLIGEPVPLYKDAPLPSNSVDLRFTDDVTLDKGKQIREYVPHPKSIARPFKKKKTIARLPTNVSIGCG